MTGSAVLTQYTRVTDVRTTELPWQIRATVQPTYTAGPIVASKKSNAVNFKKASRHAGRLFQTARLRQTKFSSSLYEFSDIYNNVN